MSNKAFTKGLKKRGISEGREAGGWYWNRSRRPYQPSPVALGWYRTGLAALRSMTYEAARKALEQAVAADPQFALAHASLARAYDEGDRPFARLATAVAKYWVSKRAGTLVGEALECLGGAGYVEESIMPRLYREAPLNSIWEGSGNVIALDVMRAIQKEPEALDAVLAEIGEVPEMGRIARAAVEQDNARLVAETLAVTLQGSLLRRFSTIEVADGFIATRVMGERGMTLGTLPNAVDRRKVIDRAWHG